LRGLFIGGPLVEAGDDQTSLDAVLWTGKETLFFLEPLVAAAIRAIFLSFVELVVVLVVVIVVVVGAVVVNLVAVILEGEVVLAAETLDGSGLGGTPSCPTALDDSSTPFADVTFFFQVDLDGDDPFMADENKDGMPELLSLTSLVLTRLSF
jgi:hypothetical protein